MNENRDRSSMTSSMCAQWSIQPREELAVSPREDLIEENWNLRTKISELVQTKVQLTRELVQLKKQLNDSQKGSAQPAPSPWDPPCK